MLLLSKFCKNRNMEIPQPIMSTYPNILSQIDDMNKRYEQQRDQMNVVQYKQEQHKSRLNAQDNVNQLTRENRNKDKSELAMVKKELEEMKRKNEMDAMEVRRKNEMDAMTQQLKMEMQLTMMQTMASQSKINNLKICQAKQDVQINNGQMALLENSQRTETAQTTAYTAQTAASTAQSTASAAQSTANSKPNVVYGFGYNHGWHCPHKFAGYCSVCNF